MLRLLSNKQQFGVFVFIVIILLSCRKHFDLNGSKQQEAESVYLPPSNGEYTALMSQSESGLSNSAPLQWGVNGHPLNQSAYTNNIDLQLSLLKQLGMDFYRVDMPTSRNGELRGVAGERLKELVTKSSIEHIKILPVLINREWHANNYTNEDAYTIGYSLAYGFANRYGQHFDFYALGNEEEEFALRYDLPHRSLIKHFFDGSDFEEDYDQEKFKKLVHFFKGMTEGVKAADPQAKIIINCSGWKHYGFFEGLNQHQISYDIIGYHWYEDNILVFRQVLSKLSLFGKDVWFTEFNRKAGSLGENGLEKQRSFVKQFLSELKGKQFVKAIFLYELFDEPEHHAGEASYGLISWRKRYSTYMEKPVMQSVKFFVEEDKHGIEDHVYSLYDHCNNRVPDKNGLSYWSNLLKEGKSKQLMIDKFLPEESYKKFIETQFRTLLGMSKYSDEDIDFWVKRIRTGMKREQVIAQMCNSREFWYRSGATKEGFVDHLYTALLGRHPDLSGKDYWVSRTGIATSNYGLIIEFLKSDEYRRFFIKEQFNQLLRRKGNVEEEAINYYLRKMKAGVDQLDIIKELLLSEEFWNNSIEEGYKRRYSNLQTSSYHGN